MSEKAGLTKLDRAIRVIDVILDDRKERVDKISKKLQQSENEKIFVGQEIELAQNVRVLIKAVTNQFTAHLGKLAPQAIDLEEAVVGAVMLEKTAIDQVIEFLLPEHFYDKRHQIIYRAVLDLTAEGSPTDMRSIVMTLRKAGEIESAGGAYYIADLTSKVSSSANLSYHGHLLIEMAGKRRMIESCAKVLTDAYSDETDFFELLEFLERETTHIKSWIK